MWCKVYRYSCTWNRITCTCKWISKISHKQHGHSNKLTYKRRCVGLYMYTVSHYSNCKARTKADADLTNKWVPVHVQGYIVFMFGVWISHIAAMSFERALNGPCVLFVPVSTLACIIRCRTPHEQRLILACSKIREIVLRWMTPRYLIPLQETVRLAEEFQVTRWLIQMTTRSMRVGVN